MNRGFQNPGVCLQAVPLFPSPTPSFVFWLSPHFSRGKNAENPVPRSFFAPKPTETLATQAKFLFEGLFSFTLTLYFDVFDVTKTYRFQALLIHACNLKITLLTLVIDFESVNLKMKFRSYYTVNHDKNLYSFFLTGKFLVRRDFLFCFAFCARKSDAEAKLLI